MNNLDTAREMRERSEECRREAERSCHASERAEWLTLSNEWLKLAQDEDLGAKVLWATRTAATPSLIQPGA
jgi:hypothetical protein